MLVTKKGRCPKCEKALVVKKSIRKRQIKPIKCKFCGFLIDTPYEVFKPVRID